MKQIISSSDYDKFLAYLSELSNDVADIRKAMKEIHTLESRKEVSKILDEAVDNLRHLRHTLGNPPQGIDRRGDFT